MTVVLLTSFANVWPKESEKTDQNQIEQIVPGHADALPTLLAWASNDPEIGKMAQRVMRGLPRYNKQIETWLQTPPEEITLLLSFSINTLLPSAVLCNHAAWDINLAAAYNALVIESQQQLQWKLLAADNYALIGVEDRGGEINLLEEMAKYRAEATKLVTEGKAPPIVAEIPLTSLPKEIAEIGKDIRADPIRNGMYCIMKREMSYAGWIQRLMLDTLLKGESRFKNKEESRFYGVDVIDLAELQTTTLVVRYKKIALKKPVDSRFLQLEESLAALRSHLMLANLFEQATLKGCQNVALVADITLSNELECSLERIGCAALIPNITRCP